MDSSEKKKIENLKTTKIKKENTTRITHPRLTLVSQPYWLLHLVPERALTQQI